MHTQHPMSAREHRDAIAREATALLGLDGSDNWLNTALSVMAAEGVFSNALDLSKALGQERSGKLCDLIWSSDRPEFRKAGIVMKTAEGMMAMVDLWLDPDASPDAYALACEPIDLSLMIEARTRNVVMLFDTSAWAGYQEAFAAAMASAESPARAPAATTV